MEWKRFCSEGESIPLRKRKICAFGGRSFAFACFIAASLAGCVGGTLSNHDEIEILPIRPATKKEGVGLKRCLLAARAAQEARLKKTGHYAKKAKSLPLDDDCGGFILTQGRSNTGYEIRAEIHDDETMVRWSVNEKGVVEEHLDTENGEEIESF